MTWEICPTNSTLSLDCLKRTVGGGGSQAALWEKLSRAKGGPCLAVGDATGLLSRPRGQGRRGRRLDALVRDGERRERCALTGNRAGNNGRMGL